MTKQTYRLPPRTTIAGMLAAIVGAKRDSYYEAFAPEVSAVAVEPVNRLRTVTEPMLGLSTNPDEHFESVGGTGNKTVQVRYPNSKLNRQLHSYELLVNPSYRIDVAVEDEAFYRALAHRLETGTAHYPLSMGLSEYIAWVEFHGEFDVETATGDTAKVDSVLPAGAGSVIPDGSATTHIERMPAFMQADDTGRRVTAFRDYTFTDDAEPITVRMDRIHPTVVNDRVVVFG